MDPQQMWLWAGAMLATHDDEALAALAFRGWATTVKRGWVMVRVAP